MATALPPRRQSCDRCHERKVRCIPTPGPKETVSAPRACERCQKAGLCCVYSPQLRPGRPLSRKDTTRRLSSASSSIVALPLTVSCPAQGSSLNANSNIIQGFHGMDGLLSPLTREDGDGCDSMFDLDLDIDLDSGLGIGEWPTLQEASDNNKERGKEHAGAALHLSSPLMTRSSSTAGSVDMERDIQELSELNIRIYRTARTIDTEATHTPLSMSSPSVVEIFDAGCTLTHILARIAGATMQGAPENPSSRLCCADTGVALMVLACHERLIDSFEAMCVAINSHVQSMSLAPSSIMQVMMVAKVISHLLNQVDRAIGPLRGQAHQDTSTSSSSSVSDDASGTTEVTFVFEQGVATAAEKESECSKMAAVALKTMQSRQTRLRAHLKVVKQLVKGANALSVT